MIFVNEIHKHEEGVDRGVTFSNHVDHKCGAVGAGGIGIDTVFDV